MSRANLKSTPKPELRRIHDEPEFRPRIMDKY